MRKKRKMIQQQVADAAGWHQSCYARIEGKAGRECTIETFVKLARVFKCKIEQIAPDVPVR